MSIYILAVLTDKIKKNQFHIICSLFTMSRPISIEEMVRLFKMRHTTSHLFKIDNFSKLHNETIESSVFTLGGHKWKLYVFSNGKHCNDGRVSIYLENQAPIHVNLKYEVYVVSQLQRIWHPHGPECFGIHSTCVKKGTSNLISPAELDRNGYRIGDCCMFGVRLHGIKPAHTGTAECLTLMEKPCNHKVTWMMTKFSSFQPEYSHCSDEFVVGNRKWRIEVHPRGFEKEKDKSFSVYLLGQGFINNALKTKTFVKFKLRVFDQITRNNKIKSGSGWFDTERVGFADFMPLKELKEPYLVKDKLCVGVEFEAISVSNYC